MLTFLVGLKGHILKNRLKSDNGTRPWLVSHMIFDSYAMLLILLNVTVTWLDLPYFDQGGIRLGSGIVVVCEPDKYRDCCRERLLCLNERAVGASLKEPAKDSHVFG